MLITIIDICHVCSNRNWWKAVFSKKGSIIKVERLQAEEKEEVEINKVICVSNNGLSCSSNAVVKAEVLEQCRDKKL